MPWPNDVLTRVVTGTYLNAAGSAAKGRVTFTPTSTIVDEDDAVVIDDTLTATLNTSGSFSIELPTTDNKLLFPEGWLYQVKVKLYGVKPVAFLSQLSYGDGSPIDIASASAFAGISGALSSPSSSSRGPIGPRGPGVLIDSGEPSASIGQDGDIYIDSDSGNYYGPKSNGEWPGTAAYSPGSTRRHVHTQSLVSSSWSVVHALGGRPSVTVVDSAGTVVIGEVVYNSDTEVTISFSNPFSGYAYLT